MTITRRIGRWLAAAGLAAGTCLTAMGGTARAQAPADAPELRFQEAWYREVAEARYEEALAVYAALAADAVLPAPLRAKALFRSGLCQRRLGRAIDATATFARVVKDFAAVADVAAAAKREQAGETEADAAFRAKLRSIVAALGAMQPAEREMARNELQAIGSAAAPELLAAIGGADNEVAKEAAGLLVAYASTDPALESALLAVVRSGDPLARKHVLDCLDDLPIAACLRLATDPDPDVRTAAARGLRPSAPTPEVLAALARLAADPVRNVRLAALDRLGRQGVAGLPAVRAALADPEGAIRAAVCAALGRISGADALGALRAALRDTDPVVRSAVVDACARRKEPAALDLAMEAAEDPDPSVRAEVAAAPTYDRDLQLTQPTFRTLILLASDADHQVAEAALQTLSQVWNGRRLVGPPTEEPDFLADLPEPGRVASALARAVRETRDTGARGVAVALLSSARSPRTVEVLVGLLADPQYDLVNAAIDALRSGRHASAVPALLDVTVQARAAHSNWQLDPMRRAVDALVGTFGDPETLGALVGRIPRMSTPIQHHTIAAMLRLERVDLRTAILGLPADLLAAHWSGLVERVRVREYRAATPFLVAVLAGGNPDACLMALRAAAEVRDPALVPAVRALLESGAFRSAAGAKFPNLAVWALQVLASVGGTEAEAELVRQLGDSDPAVRTATAGFLTSFPPERAGRALVEALGREGSGEARPALVQAIAHFALPEAVPALLAGLREPAGRGGRPEAEALLAYPPAQAFEALRTVIVEAGYPEDARVVAIHALSGVPSLAARRCLVELLRSPTSRIREAAAVVLPNLPPDPALARSLADFLLHEDVRVRTAARGLLDEIRKYVELKKMAEDLAKTASEKK